MSQSAFVVKRGWALRLARGGKAQHAIEQSARRFADQVVENLPVVTGRLAEEWGPMTPRIEAGPNGARAVCPIGSWRWHFIERGTIHNPPYSPIRNAADSLRMEIDLSGPGGG